MIKLDNVTKAFETQAGAALAADHVSFEVAEGEICVLLRRNIGDVIQQIGVFPNMTVEENICVVPKLLGWDMEKARKRAASTAPTTSSPTRQRIHCRFRRFRPDTQTTSSGEGRSGDRSGGAESAGRGTP